MDELETINDGDENLSSLIRASIDIDDWISNDKTRQLDAQESRIIDDQDSNFFSQGYQQNIPDSFHPTSSGLCEKEFCELGKCKNTLPFIQSECLSTMEIRNSANCIHEPGEQTHNLIEHLQDSVEESITLEKTPEQIRYEDIINRSQALNAENQLKNINKTAVEVGDFETIQNLPSFQDAFANNWIKPYIEAAEGLRIQQEHELQIACKALKTTNCYRCREIIEPRDWIRSITGGTDFTAVYHMNCFYCDYCKGVFCTDQYYTFHQEKLICNFDFQMLTNLRKVPDLNKKRLVVLHSVKKGRKKNVRISLEQKEILQRALRSKNRPKNVKQSS